jgi:tetratricopeptide (TPR) repeat protein
MIRAALLCLLPLPALAQDICPPAPDHRAAIAELYDRIQGAPSEAVGQRLSGDLWAFWTDAPDDRAQGLLDMGMERRQIGNLMGSYEVLTQLVEYCPDYAEGWNQRAFTSYLAGRHGEALTDLDRALALDPTHSAALSGKALTLMWLGRRTEAQEVLREAVRLNPWMNERHLLEAPIELEL